MAKKNVLGMLLSKLSPLKEVSGTKTITSIWSPEGEDRAFVKKGYEHKLANTNEKIFDQGTKTSNVTYIESLGNSMVGGASNKHVVSTDNMYDKQTDLKKQLAIKDKTPLKKQAEMKKEKVVGKKTNIKAAVEKVKKPSKAINGPLMKKGNKC